MRGLAGKVALITGGSSGIGLATARVLGAAGARVAIAARGQERGEAAARALREAGVDAFFVRADMARAEEVRHMVEQLVERWGGLDLAVNNAATGDLSLVPTADISEEEFDRTIAVNLKGVWLCMKHELPAMLRGGKGGAIVNVSSVNGLTGVPMGSLYCASKHAVHGLSKSAASEYARAGIRVNVVCPGAHRTPMLEGLFERISPGDPKKAEETVYTARIPMGRIGDAEESARAIAWLLSDEASYVTGAVLTVDGGVMASM